MKHCNKCNVDIKDCMHICPLCKAVLPDPSDCAFENAYPQPIIDVKQFNFLKRLFIFISVVAILASVIINLIFYYGVLWSLITAAGIIYLWIGILHSLAHHANIAAKIVVQSFLGSLFIVLLDFLIGYKGWSINLVIPSIFIVANIAIVILILINRMDWRNYLLYQFAIAFMGFIPLILFLITRIGNPVMVIIAAGISFLTLLGTFIFGDKTVKNELKKRLHV